MSYRKDLVSIIIPVYNVENYIDRCLQTVTNQTYDKIEIILIDDGSTDRSGKKCDEWEQKDSRIIVIHQENAGAGAARNKGLEIASGEYIGFVDSDDWISLNMYETMMSLIKSHEDTDIAICELMSAKSYDDNYKQEKYKTIPYRLLDQNDLLDSFFRVHGEKSNYGIYLKLIKKERLAGFRFVEETISEDVRASFFFATHSRNGVYTEVPLYFYFQNADGVTRAKVSRKDLEYINAFYDIYVTMRNSNKQYTEIAYMNYIRSNFSILSKYKIYGAEAQNEILKDNMKKIKRTVRKHFWELLRWKMPLSRKVLLFYVCI